MCIRDSENGVEIGDPTETALINLGSRCGIEAADVRNLYPCLLYTSPSHETVLDLVCRLLLEKKKL